MPDFTGVNRMPLFDLRTVILMSSVMPGLMAIALFSLARNFPQNIRGIRHWALGALLVSVSVILLAFRGSVPDWLSIVAANSGIVFGTGLGLIGSQLFFGRRPAWRFVLLLLVLGAAGTTYMWQAHESVVGRIACMTGILALIYGAHGALVLRFGRFSHSGLSVGAVLLAESAVASVRCITVVLPTVGPADFFYPERIQTFYLTAGAVFSLMVPVGFLLMAIDRLRSQLEQQSYRDPLTGLLNRRAFVIAYERERERVRRSGGVLSMLLIDLDHFKQVNDRHGHEVGDSILADFSRRAAEVLPSFGYLSRWGGEEFAVLLPGLFPQEAHRLAEAVRLRIAEEAEIESPDVHYTCSIGVACLAAAEATIEQLARDADNALYQAKHRGRNCVELSDHALLV
jgi:diguanylate cyclase (GGDEF)-like protein